MIAVIDSGVANLASVMAALQRLKADAEITADAAKIRTASHVILPGVGAAAAAMAQLDAKGLSKLVPQLTQPVLGICLGMQLLFERTEESGGTACLGVIPGTVKLLPAAPDRPVPHMGWNTLRKDANHPLLRDVVDESFVYYVHSFAAPVGAATLASTGYGDRFTAVAGHKNFLGCQFHPERSSEAGSRILQNFLGL